MYDETNTFLESDKISNTNFKESLINANIPTCVHL